MGYHGGTMIRSMVLTGLAGVILAGCVGAERDASLDPQSSIVPPSKVHPVTPEMQRHADALALKDAPAFSLPDLKGLTMTNATLGPGKPQFFYFINSECPCCVTAEPIVQRLFEEYGEAVEFAGIIDADQKRAQKWAEANGATYTILLDPKKTTIAAFGAEAGVYMAVVNKEGKIDKLYPGYNKESLKELSARLARLGGVEPKAIDFPDAPDKLTSGCTF